MARRWVEGGDSVEWFTASFPGAEAISELDGVRVLRQGRQWTVHARAVARYRGRLRGRFDVVVDEVNTIPFFTPWWAGIPSVLLIYQLAKEVWWYESPPAVAAAGFALEPWYLRAYRSTPAFTISPSTEGDLRRLGWRAPVTVIPVGIEQPDGPQHPQHSGNEIAFLYAGRLNPSKRVHEIVAAFAEYRRGGGRGRLWLVGEGTPAYLGRLRRDAARLGVEGDLELTGRVSREERDRRMEAATALLMASVREGWGLVVTEAGARGTPAIVYDVPGLRDAVRDCDTGLVVPPEPRAMAAAMRRLADDPRLRRRLGRSAAAWSLGFTFDRSAAALRAGLERAAG
jgi:glycosyltransferase involved in cell wall biosynthesis